jgi:hypothetical protein
MPLRHIHETELKYDGRTDRKMEDKQNKHYLHMKYSLWGINIIENMLC